MPTTEQVRTDYVLTYTERESSQLMAGAAFDRWIAAHDREVKAEAWDEALSALTDSYWDGDGKPVPNPYR